MNERIRHNDNDGGGIDGNWNVIAHCFNDGIWFLQYTDQKLYGSNMGSPRNVFFAILLLSSTIAIIRCEPVSSSSSSSNRKHERIKVPLGRRLTDALSANTAARSTSYARRFAIEVDDESDTTTNINNGGGAILLVEEVHHPAITSETTFSFHKDRQFDATKLKDITILASNPQDHDNSGASGGGLTVLSINKSTGEIKGFQRGGHVAGGEGHVAHSITHDPNDRDRIRIRRMQGQEEVAMKDWSCDAVHPDYTLEHENDGSVKRLFEDRLDHHHMHHTTTEHGGHTRKSNIDINSSTSSTTPVRNTPPQWTTPTKYAFNIDLSIDIDKSFISKQGSPEAAIEYIHVLISAANIILENEVDAHLNILSINEQTFYDTLTTTKEALRAQRLHPRPEYDKGGSRHKQMVLHHALLGRWLGGGIAFINSICEKNWGFGVTSDISGNLNDINELVLFDFFILTHELGHSLGSEHTFEYEPPVDGCGVCTVTQPPPSNRNGETSRAAKVDGLPKENSATIMSYCNFCDGGISNIATTMGGVWNGRGSKADIDNWKNHPDIVGSVSKEPRRVSHEIWSQLNSKLCVDPPTKEIQGCNDNNDCDDRNICTIDTCEDGTNICTVSKTLNSCCGNGKCEPGERPSCTSDCGPFVFDSPQCSILLDENCHVLDGFMVDIGLNRKAPQKIYVNGVKLAYKSPQKSVATIDVYMTTKLSYIGSVNGGSYIGKERVPDDWEKLISVAALKYNQKKETELGYIDINFQNSIPIEIGEIRGFYIVASEEIIKFEEGVYDISNDDGMVLHSSLAVTGLFGDGVNGFGLNVGVNYSLDDSPPVTVSPTTSPTTPLPVPPPFADLVGNVLEGMQQTLATMPSSSPRDAAYAEVAIPSEVEPKVITSTINSEVEPTTINVEGKPHPIDANEASARHSGLLWNIFKSILILILPAAHIL